MKYILLLLSVLFTLTFSSCSSSKKTIATQNDNAVAGATVSSNGEADGSSFEKAIVIDEKTETKGIAAEYAWIKKNYPGYKMRSQSLSHKGKKSYDIIHIETADGKLVDLYFDITKFFGKF